MPQARNTVVSWSRIEAAGTRIVVLQSVGEPVSGALASARRAGGAAGEARGSVGAGLQARDDLPGELGGEAPLVVHPGREHQLLEAVGLERPDALDQLIGGPHQAGGPDQIGV